MTQSKQGERVIVITGASGALGSEVAARFVRYGDSVVAWDIDAPGPGALVQDERKRSLFWMNVDVTDAGVVDDAVATVEQEIGPIDAFVHCAGGFRWSHIDKISAGDIDFLVDLNLRSSLYVAHSVLGPMKERGQGRLIFISSRSTIKPGAGEGAYAATKAGLNALTVSLADEVKDSEITVNALQPSVIDTEANRADMPDADFSTWVPTGELVDLVEYLIGEKARSISGAQIAVSGRT
jgi:NAD(P)-dependent dehydrogenase (short-subunit alcohol dehydrogenase family)